MLFPGACMSDLNYVILKNKFSFFQLHLLRADSQSNCKYQDKHLLHLHLGKVEPTF